MPRKRVRRSPAGGSSSKTSRSAADDRNAPLRDSELPRAIDRLLEYLPQFFSRRMSGREIAQRIARQLGRSSAQNADSKEFFWNLLAKAYQQRRIEIKWIDPKESEWLRDRLVEIFQSLNRDSIRLVRSAEGKQPVDMEVVGEAVAEVFLERLCRVIEMKVKQAGKSTINIGIVGGRTSLATWHALQRFPLKEYLAASLMDNKRCKLQFIALNGMHVGTENLDSSHAIVLGANFAYSFEQALRDELRDRIEIKFLGFHGPAIIRTTTVGLQKEKKQRGARLSAKITQEMKAQTNQQRETLNQQNRKVLEITDPGSLPGNESNAPSALDIVILPLGPAPAKLGSSVLASQLTEGELQYLRKQKCAGDVLFQPLDPAGDKLKLDDADHAQPYSALSLPTLTRLAATTGRYVIACAAGPNKAQVTAAALKGALANSLVIADDTAKQILLETDRRTSGDH